jgi:hypothetical protein
MGVRAALAMTTSVMEGVSSIGKCGPAVRLVVVGDDSQQAESSQADAAAPAVLHV